MCCRIQEAEKTQPKIPEKRKAKFCRSSERYTTLILVFFIVFSFCPIYFLARNDIYEMNHIELQI